MDALGQARSATDLEGLADAFDSNRDGVFDAHDAQFAEFKVWQDANQNGVSDEGEVRSLADWGLTSIQLVSDGVQRTPADGVVEAGRSTATATDGTSVLVADAAFEYRTALPEEAPGVAPKVAPEGSSQSSAEGLFQLGLAGPVLNLEAAVPQASDAAQGAVAGPLPAQTSVKLFLYDMLQSAATSESGAEAALFASERGEHDQPQTLQPGHGLHTDASLDVLMQQALRGGDLS